MRDTAAHSIHLDALTKSFGGPDPAVDDLSLEIRQGEFFSLLGPSGCGKTTTLRMIAGFEAPTAGRILLDEREITRLPAHKRNMGMVFQNYALFPHRTVFQNVAFGLRMRRATNAEIARRVERALGQVELTGFEDRYPSQLSGGQQQRVALARAIVIEPAVLLCDEPLGALDKRLRATMQFELKELQRSLGITLVYVTHDQEEALTMSDRIAVMNRGRVEQVDTPQTVYTAPATPFVSGFIGESNLFEGVFDAVANRLDCADGISIPLAPAPHRLANMRLTAAIRPEHLRFAPPAEAVFTGEVREANFLGTATLYKVAVGAAPALLVRVPTGSDQPEVAPGTTVSIGVNAEAVRIVDRPGR